MTDIASPNLTADMGRIAIALGSNTSALDALARVGDALSRLAAPALPEDIARLKDIERDRDNQIDIARTLAGRITELEAEIERLKKHADRDAAGELIVSLQRSIADLESNVAEAQKAKEELADCIMNYCNYPDCDYPDCCLPASPLEHKA